MVTAIRTGKPIEPDLVDGMRAQAVAEAAVESLQQGKPVAIVDVWQAK